MMTVLRYSKIHVLRISITVILLSIYPSWAMAETRDFGTAGGYEVVGEASTEGEVGACMATFTYEGSGSTELSLFRKADDADFVTLFVTNFLWSANKDKEYKLRYEFDKSFYDRSAKGVQFDNGYSGFLSVFPVPEFFSIYAASTYLHISMDGGNVDRLSLKGSAAGMSLFNKCWAWVLGTERVAESRRNRLKGIPRDPFAE
jgi:hypothetical protein